MDTITYAYVNKSGTERHVEWTGDIDAAIAAGIEALGGKVIEGDRVLYFDDATHQYWTCDRADVAELGAAILDGRSLNAAYSIWCSGTELCRLTAAQEEER